MKLGHGDRLPVASTGREYSGKFVLRLDPNLHRLFSLRAEAVGDSLNNFVVKKLQAV